MKFNFGLKKKIQLEKDQEGSIKSILNDGNKLKNKNLKHHFILFGTSGTGKSHMVKDILLQEELLKAKQREETIKNIAHEKNKLIEAVNLKEETFDRKKL